MTPTRPPPVGDPPGLRRCARLPPRRRRAGCRATSGTARASPPRGDPGRDLGVRGDPSRGDPARGDPPCRGPTAHEPANGSRTRGDPAGTAALRAGSARVIPAWRPTGPPVCARVAPRAGPSRPPARRHPRSFPSGHHARGSPHVSRALACQQTGTASARAAGPRSVSLSRFSFALSASVATEDR